MGKIFENFIVGELKKQATWSKIIVNMYHCRTTEGQEVDVILEDRSGNIISIEIKNSETVGAQDFKGLTYLRDKVKEKFIMGIVLYTGSLCLPFDKNLYMMPVNGLWEDSFE